MTIRTFDEFIKAEQSTITEQSKKSATTLYVNYLCWLIKQKSSQVSTSELLEQLAHINAFVIQKTHPKAHLLANDAYSRITVGPKKAHIKRFITARNNDLAESMGPLATNKPPLEMVNPWTLLTSGPKGIKNNLMARLLVGTAYCGLAMATAVVLNNVITASTLLSQALIPVACLIAPIAYYLVGVALYNFSVFVINNFPHSKAQDLPKDAFTGDRQKRLDKSIGNCLKLTSGLISNTNAPDLDNLIQTTTLSYYHTRYTTGEYKVKPIDDDTVDLAVIKWNMGLS